MNLEKLLDAINQADSIKIDDTIPLKHWSVEEINGDPENQVLYVEWLDGDDDGISCCTKFTEEGLSKAEVGESYFLAEDYEGEPTALYLFMLMPINIYAL